MSQRTPRPGHFTVPTKYKAWRCALRVFVACVPPDWLPRFSHLPGARSTRRAVATVAEILALSHTERLPLGSRTRYSVAVCIPVTWTLKPSSGVNLTLKPRSLPPLTSTCDFSEGTWWAGLRVLLQFVFFFGVVFFIILG